MAQDGIEVFLLLNQKGFDNWMDSMEVSSPLSREIVSEWLNNDASERPIFRTGSTLEEVAQRSGVDVQGLVATVEHFNQMVANGVDEDFGRTEMSVALEADGAWYLIEQRLRMATSLGGLKTSTTFEVFDESEMPIPGLWASGEVIGGVHGTESMPSCCVGWAVTSGRLAAQAISESLR
jgi:fumarate reductase flavoprotein subunit